MDKTSLGDRMKGYENISKYKLTKKTPVIMRLDGKAFHTFTRGFEKPYSHILRNLMLSTTKRLVKEIQGVKCAYVQSDEISLLLSDLDSDTTQGWFDWNVQKMTSVSSGIASAHFTFLYNSNKFVGDIYVDPCLGLDKSCDRILTELLSKPLVLFDSRVFNIHETEICNYFIWRQNDWIRNSVQMLAQSEFSHKQLLGKKKLDMLNMLKEKNIDWESLESYWKYGSFITKEESIITVNKETPIFVNERELFPKLIERKEVI